MKIKLFCFVLAWFLLPSAVQGAEVEDIEDLLEARWFEVEMIVFERLPVLDVNSSEALTLTTPRQWPNNLMEMAAYTGGDITAPPDLETELAPLDPAPPFCFGYPLWPEADPLHPLLAPPEESVFGDAEMTDVTTDVELESDAQLSDTEPMEAELSEDEAAPAAEPDARLAPMSTPQLTLTPYLKLLADVAEFEAWLYATSYQWLPELTMIDMVKAINRQNHLRPLLHRRWRLPVPPRDAPQPIYIATDTDEQSPLTASGFAKLEGYVHVTVGRYLHVAPTLWYHADTLGVMPLPFTGLDSRSIAMPKPDPLAHMALNESRRVRSGDLHYLDHPKFGVIVRIDPVAIPEPLEQARAALSESVE